MSIKKGTSILTLYGNHPIEELEGGKSIVWGFKSGKWTPSEVRSVRSDDTKPVFRVVLEDAIGRHTTLLATADQGLLLKAGGYVNASKAEPKTELLVASTSSSGQRHGAMFLTVKPNADWEEADAYMHDIVAAHYGKHGEVVHHKDDNGRNNYPDNLEALPRGKHTILTTGKPETVAKLKLKNHKVVSVNEAGSATCYSLVTSTANYALAQVGIFIHNETWLLA